MRFSCWATPWRGALWRSRSFSVADAPVPINPTLATAISAARSIGTILTAIGTIWGFARTQDLTGLYNWFHGSNAAAAGSAVLFVLCFGWGLWRKYVDRTVVSAASIVGVDKNNAKAVSAAAMVSPVDASPAAATGAGSEDAAPADPPAPGNSGLAPGAVPHV